MLVSLSIRNFVLIEDAVLQFDNGLTVLTGETGAGKTLLTRALGLLMGERAEEGLVGPAGDEASIEAVFTVDAAALDDVPEQIRDLVADARDSDPAERALDGSGSVRDGATVRAEIQSPRVQIDLIASRRLSREGRNRCYVNGSAVTLATLGNLLGRLLSFAGQHEYRRLLDPAYQLQVLDEWAGIKTVELAERYRRAFVQARDTMRALEETERSRETREREAALLRYEVDELAAAGLSVAEEEALVTEQRLLAKAGEVLAGAGLTADILKSDGDGPDATGLVAQACEHLGRLAGVDDSLDESAAGLLEVQYRLEEITREIRSQLDRITVDPERLQMVEDRLRLYTDLARKYGGCTAAALEHLEDSRRRLTELERSENDLRGLEEARAAQRALALDLAAELSARRREAAPRLEEAVRVQLADLGMAEACLHVAWHSRSDGWEGLRESGAESVEFLLVANPGQPPRSLAATASGGELSRVLLALKCALAGADSEETLVFDEIDAGIGGRTAVAVASKLRELSRASQSVVVTHLASVAAQADCHYLIDKVRHPATAVSGGAGAMPGGDGTVGVEAAGGAATILRRLDEAAVVEELCRMMGGHSDDAEAMAHARELRERARRSMVNEGADAC